MIVILFVILHQAVRYLMRFQSEYTCGLLNVARHAAFGKEAASMVLKSFAGEWPKVGNSSSCPLFCFWKNKQTDFEKEKKITYSFHSIVNFLLVIT